MAASVSVLPQRCGNRMRRQDPVIVPFPSRQADRLESVLLHWLACQSATAELGLFPWAREAGFVRFAAAWWLASQPPYPSETKECR